MGHVVRAAALALYVKDAGHRPVIFFTWSKYTIAAQILQDLDIEYEFFYQLDWKEDMMDEVVQLQPDLVVTTEFPFGIHGEWNTPDSAWWEFVHIGRRLQWGKYLSKVGYLPPSTAQHLLQHAITLEPLEPAHEGYLCMAANHRVRTNGWLQFPAERIKEHIPTHIARYVTDPNCHLIIHNGDEDETRTLHNRAVAYANDGEPIVTVCPEEPNFLKLSHVEPNHRHWLYYFPARHLIKYCKHVYTAGGYSAMAECERYKHKHHRNFFQRAYDQQVARGKQPKLRGRSTERIADYIIKIAEGR